MTMEHNSQQASLESILREWLTDPEITLICGQWRSGAIMELLPQGRAWLSAQKYGEQFAGLRDLIIEGEGHHLHLDLHRFQSVVYAVLPSVCYGFRPSFEVHFVDRGEEVNPFVSSFSLSLHHPYEQQHVRRPQVLRYFRRLLDHARRYPALVHFHTESPTLTEQSTQGAWGEIVACLFTAMNEGTMLTAEPSCLTTFHVWLRQLLAIVATTDATT